MKHKNKKVETIGCARDPRGRPYGYLDYDPSFKGCAEDTTEALIILLGANFNITSRPVEAVSKPTLSIGPYNYYGLNMIRRVAKHFQETDEVAAPDFGRKV